MLEVRALAQATNVLRQAQDIRGGQPRAMIVLSMVGKTYRLTQDMKDAAAALELPLAKTALTLKQIYADAPGQGAVVWQLGARGREAADEVEALFREVLPEACASKRHGGPQKGGRMTRRGEPSHGRTSITGRRIEAEPGDRPDPVAKQAFVFAESRPRQRAARPRPPTAATADHAKPNGKLLGRPHAVHDASAPTSQRPSNARHWSGNSKGSSQYGAGHPGRSAGTVAAQAGYLP